MPFRLFGQFGVAEHLLDSGKPNRFVRFAVQEDLRFRAVVFSQIHAAVMTDRAVADLLGAGGGLLSCLLQAANAMSVKVVNNIFLIFVAFRKSRRLKSKE